MIGPEGLGLRVGGQHELGVGDQQHFLEQVVEVLLFLRRDAEELNRPTPLLRAEVPRRRGRRVPGSGSAAGTSILFTATTIGTPAAFACEIDSRVCGMTPSSAATTRTAMSVTFAPRARMAVNASWPGVSRKVSSTVVLDLVGADVLRDAAGLGLDDRGLADRVQQRRLPVVDVAHDRDDRWARLEDSSGSSKASGSSSSSACLIVTSRLTLGSAAIRPISSSERDWVIALSPRPIMILMIDATGIPSACESSLTVTPDWTVTGPVGTTTSRGCFGWRSVRSRAWRESGRGLLGLRVDDHAALAPAASLRLARPNRPVGAVLSLFVSHGQCSSVEA